MSGKRPVGATVIIAGGVIWLWGGLAEFLRVPFLPLPWPWLFLVPIGFLAAGVIVLHLHHLGRPGYGVLGWAGLVVTVLYGAMVATGDPDPIDLGLPDEDYVVLAFMGPTLFLAALLRAGVVPRGLIALLVGAIAVTVLAAQIGTVPEYPARPSAVTAAGVLIPWATACLAWMGIGYLLWTPRPGRAGTHGDVSLVTQTTAEGR